MARVSDAVVSGTLVISTTVSKINPPPRPGWLRLWRHSYRLGVGWLLRGAKSRWNGARVGLARLLIPMDPWRYYELGIVADSEFSGFCLDVSSPKLLTSLLQNERKGNWLSIDIFHREIENWRWVDPNLRLEVEDVTQLAHADETFDNCICISVVEHIAESGDTTALAEIWRVLKRGGVLHLTTNICRTSRELFVENEIYGTGSKRLGGRVFFERHYSDDDLDRRLLRQPWEVLQRQYARQIDASIQERFYRHRPWSYLYGGLLRRKCPDNFEVDDSMAILQPGEQGVVYLKLRKPDCEL